MESTLHTVRDKALALWREAGILDESVTVSAGPLSVKDAIGTPDATDFPIQQGKEKLMEAVFRGRRGQAFTDRYGLYEGTLADVAALPLTDNFERAVFVATLNAVARSLDMASNTVHCRDEGPKQCSREIFDHIRQKHGRCRITIIGFQPAMAQALNEATEVRLVDMDPDNVGQTKRGVYVEGEDATRDAMAWCDVLLVTGTTLANGTIDRFLATDKPVLFYGTTIAAAAALMGWNRYCPQSS